MSNTNRNRRASAALLVMIAIVACSVSATAQQPPSDFRVDDRSALTDLHIRDVTSQLDDPWWPEPQKFDRSAIESALVMPPQPEVDFQTQVVTAEFSAPVDDDQRTTTTELPSSPDVAKPAEPLTRPVSTDASNVWHYETPNYAEPLDLRGLVFQLFIGTAIVLGGCVGMMWLSKWLLKSGKVMGRTGDRLRIVETLAVAPRCCVQLLQVDQQKLLVAVDAGGIKSVTPLTEPFASSLGELEPTEPAGSADDGSMPDTRWPGIDLERFDAARNR